MHVNACKCQTWHKSSQIGLCVLKSFFNSGERGPESQVLHAAECQEGPEDRPAIGFANFQHILKAKQRQHRIPQEKSRLNKRWIMTRKGGTPDKQSPEPVKGIIIPIQKVIAQLKDAFSIKAEPFSWMESHGKSPWFNGQIHEKLPFSVAMLNYQRVVLLLVTSSCSKVLLQNQSRELRVLVSAWGWPS